MKEWGGWRECFQEKKTMFEGPGVERHMGDAKN